MVLNVVAGILFGVGMYFILADAMKVPFYNTSKAVGSLAKRQREKTSGIEIWL